MKRFGTVAVAALAGAALAGCDLKLPSMDGADAPRPRAQADEGLEVEAACPPPAEQACPSVEGKTTVVVVDKDAGGKTTAKARTVKSAKAVKARRAAKRHYAHDDYGSGLAGGTHYRRYSGREYARAHPWEGRGGSYQRYSDREYARAHPWEGRGGGSYQHYEASPPRVRAYAYESRERSSESVRAYESEAHYGHGVAEGSAHGYGHHGGFDPRYEAYYTAGRDSGGYLVWPGKTP